MRHGGIHSGKSDRYGILLRRLHVPRTVTVQDTPRFVSFEGIDGSGKSTLVKGVAHALRETGHEPVVTREETTGWLGAAVRRNIAEHGDPLATLYLFLADRAHHLAVLGPEFEAGRLVITDRYHDSTRAYQAVTLGDRFGGPEAFDAWLHETVRPWLVVPRRTYLVDLEPETAVSRMAGRDDKTPYEKAAFLGKVRDRYRALAAAEPARFKVLDGTLSPEALVAAVVDDLRASGLLDRPSATP